MDLISAGSDYNALADEVDRDEDLYKYLLTKKSQGFAIHFTKYDWKWKAKCPCI